MILNNCILTNNIIHFYVYRVLNTVPRDNFCIAIILEQPFFAETLNKFSYWTWWFDTEIYHKSKFENVIDNFR